ncbi:MAG: CBS domain-containing protein [Actinomycetota bacterium]|nr:CBS domain-containing protein [Acidimicrobiia bacterium]MDQ3293782.1 CBS domain-containing protein [Actinomycetota bacterium]
MLIEHLLATKGNEVVTVAADTTIAAVVAVLQEHGIGAIVVSDDDGGTVAGIVSERDIVRAVADRGGAALDEPVSALMTTDVVTCQPSARIEDLMAVMTEHRFRHLPVVDDGRLVGIVSIGDVVKVRVSELAEETRTLHEYVASGR